MKKKTLGQNHKAKFIPPTIEVVRLAAMQIICTSDQPRVQPPTTEMEEGDDNW